MWLVGTAHGRIPSVTLTSRNLSDPLLSHWRPPRNRLNSPRFAGDSLHTIRPVPGTEVVYPLDLEQPIRLGKGTRVTTCIRTFGHVGAARVHRERFPAFFRGTPR